MHGRFGQFITVGKKKKKKKGLSGPGFEPLATVENPEEHTGGCAHLTTAPSNKDIYYRINIDY